MSKALSKEFIRRRRINWLSLAFLYGSFYALRYNLSLANKSICDEYGFSNAQFGLIITATYVAYAIGQFVNGPIVDRFGGKKMMLFGAAGTIIANILFGISAYTGVLNLFVAVWVLNGYMQAYGSPGNLKVNGSWFDTKSAASSLEFYRCRLLRKTCHHDIRAPHHSQISLEMGLHSAGARNSSSLSSRLVFCEGDA